MHPLWSSVIPWKHCYQADSWDRFGPRPASHLSKARQWPGLQTKHNENAEKPRRTKIWFEPVTLRGSTRFQAPPRHSRVVSFSFLWILHKGASAQHLDSWYWWRRPQLVCRVDEACELRQIRIIGGYLLDIPWRCVVGMPIAEVLMSGQLGSAKYICDRHTFFGVLAELIFWNLY